jgi:hypothetical protein
VRGGKYYFSVAKNDDSPKLDCKTPNSQSERPNGVERKNVRRPKTFNADDWYKKAAQSMAISAKR